MAVEHLHGWVLSTLARANAIQSLGSAFCPVFSNPVASISTETPHVGPSLPQSFAVLVIRAPSSTLLKSSSASPRACMAKGALNSREITKMAPFRASECRANVVSKTWRPFTAIGKASSWPRCSESYHHLGTSKGYQLPTSHLPSATSASVLEQSNTETVFYGPDRYRPSTPNAMSGMAVAMRALIDVQSGKCRGWAFKGPQPNQPWT